MTKRPGWEPTPEEWRTLAITFVGGVASIIVGAAVIGAALALARWEARGAGAGQWITLAVFTVVFWPATVYQLKPREPRSRASLILTGSNALISTLLLLVWIGVAAGVK